MFKLLLIYNIFRGWEAVGKEVEKVGRAQGKISRRPVVAEAMLKL